MNITPEELARVQRVIRPIIRPHKLDLEFPMAVWGSNDVGAILHRDSAGKGQDAGKKFRASASFVLFKDELKSEPKIKAKADIAVAALLNAVYVRIAEQKPKKAAA